MTGSGGLFEGLKVLDVASYIAAPVATTILADFGADVIKIEAPGGDGYRRLHRAPGMPIADMDYAWAVDNRGKRGLALDLGSEEGRGVLERLVRQADVFVTNFPFEVRAKLRLGWEDIAPLNDRLIYASLTAYGEEGPEAVRTGFDSTALWARSGMMDLVKTDPEVAPARSTPGMGDHPTGTALFAAIMMGLYRRERTGAGSHVSTSLLANGAWMNAFYVQAALMGAEIPPRPHRDHAPNALANHYRCRDGRWFILALLNEDRQCPKFLEAIGRADLMDDPRFADTPGRHRNAAALTRALDETLATEDWAYWRGRFDACGITYGQVARVTDVPDDAQMKAAGVVVPLALPGRAPGHTVAAPVAVRGCDQVPARPAPGVGEHTAQILAEIGYDAAAIERMAAERVVVLG